MTPRQVVQFQTVIYDFYKGNKRTFPWRTTKNPYYILVSEVMLQQTQTERVVPKYNAFIATFPTLEDLANAPFSDVVSLWQGLGYNRRCKMLHELAKVVTKEYGGSLPKEKKKLESLPGIGPYSAGAIMAFAYNKPTIMIETNIRSVYLHHFFSKHGDVHDKEILPLIEATLDMLHPRKWYSALMDYGAHLKKTHPNPNRKSSHYSKQSRFEGSDRQIRGEIIRILSLQPTTSKQLESYIAEKYQVGKERLKKIISKLINEKMVVKKGQTLSI